MGLVYCNGRLLRASGEFLREGLSQVWLRMGLSDFQVLFYKRAQNILGPAGRIVDISEL